MRLRIMAGIAGLVASTTISSTAAAADAGDKETSTLEVEIGEKWQLLSSDCATACRALQSIQRAADRICELEPGARCDNARAKADDAARRVHASCPDCVLAQTPKKDKGKDDERRAMEPPAPVQAGDSAKTAQAAPQAESARGGCRSCDASGASPSDLAQVGLVLGVLARVLRRRKTR